MRISDLRKDFLESLSGIYDTEEILSFFYLLTEKKLGLGRVDVAINLNKTIDASEYQYFSNALKRLQLQEPIQYIIGDTAFFGMSFLVNKDVLIPRPETEELVDWVLKDHKKNQPVKILDVGTGSGCIAISLAKNLPGSKVVAIDVSDGALQIAKENAKRNGVEIRFIKGDILKDDIVNEDFDIIISNPPYVRELEKKEMKPNVLKNEPSLALFVSNDKPLVFYEKITVLAKQRLRTNGTLYFEINQYLGLETQKMIEKSQFGAVVLRKDVYHNDRMIRARFK